MSKDMRRCAAVVARGKHYGVFIDKPDSLVELLSDGKSFYSVGTAFIPADTTVVVTERGPVYVLVTRDEDDPVLQGLDAAAELLNKRTY